MDLRFRLLLGAPYRGGSLLLDGSELFSPAGNRVTRVDLEGSRSATYEAETTSSVRTLAASPDGKLLLAVDDAGRAAFLSRRGGVALYRASFRGRVRAAAWSPDGRHLAVAVGRLVRVWRSPPLHAAVAPLELVRTYGQAHDDVRCLSWSPDSTWLIFGGKDALARVVSLRPIASGYRVPTLAGHLGDVVGAWFATERQARDAQLAGNEPPAAYTVSRDGVVHVWGYVREGAEDLGAKANAAWMGGNEDDWKGADDGEEDAEESGDDESQGDGAGEEPEESGDSGDEEEPEESGDSGDEEEPEESGDSGADEDDESASLDSSSSSPPSSGKAKKRPRSPLAPLTADPFPPRGAPSSASSSAPARASPAGQSLAYYGGHWRLITRVRLERRGAFLSSVAFEPRSGLMAAGLSDGSFRVLAAPDFAVVHSLSLGSSPVTSLSFGHGGEWIAAGCARLGQLLVWEWRSERHVVRQQGHAAAAAAVAFSPDGALLATAGDDGRVKVWAPRTGFCFVTFADHRAPVGGLAWAPNGAAVVAAGRDGCVRAFDLVRNRCFRVMTTPEPAQFGRVSVDPSGALVAAAAEGGDFRVPIWELRTGRLLELLAGHEAPVADLAFAPAGTLLATCSWDKTARVWDAFSGEAKGDPLPHSAEVLALAWAPDGKRLATSALDGAVSFWDPLEGTLEGQIAARKDVAGGRLRASARSAVDSPEGKCFTALAFSPDGATLVAGGESKRVCVYDAAERVLLRRIVIATDVRIDGALDRLRAGDVTEAGATRDAILPEEDADSGDEGGVVRGGAPEDPRFARAGRTAHLPGARGADAAPVAQARALAVSPAGGALAIATPQGVALYEADSAGAGVRASFDPAALAEDVTPAAVLRASARGAHARAVAGALALGDAELARAALLAAPAAEAARLAVALPAPLFPAAIRAAADLVRSTPHVAHGAAWLRALLGRKPDAARDPSAAVALRAAATELARVGDEVAAAARRNVFALDAILLAAQAEERAKETLRRRKQENEDEEEENEDDEEESPSSSDAMDEDEGDSSEAASEEADDEAPAPPRDAKGRKGRGAPAARVRA